MSWEIRSETVNVSIREATRDDAAAIAEIYNDAVVNTAAIWNDVTVDADNRVVWLEDHWEKGYPVLVAVSDGDVVGYCTFGDWRNFDGYRYTVENSIYVHPEHQGRGVGNVLMGALIEAARGVGKHVIVAAIEGENAGSIALHEKWGFERVGFMPQVGCKFGRWLDAVFLQLILDSEEKPR